MVRGSLAALVLLLAPLAPAPAREIEPDPVGRARTLRASEGLLIFSLRSQNQLDGKLSVWFEAVDEETRARGDYLKFERKQGVPLLGANMIDRAARAYISPAGRWRLLAHTTRCGDLPPPNTQCVILSGPMSGTFPTARYDGSTIVLDVRPGRVFNAGELMLEFPAGTDVETPSVNVRRRLGSTMRLRWRPLPSEDVSRLAQPFSRLAVDAIGGISENERSAVTCENDEAKINDGLTLPFDC